MAEGGFSSQDGDFPYADEEGSVDEAGVTDRRDGDSVKLSDDKVSYYIEEVWKTLKFIGYDSSGTVYEKNVEKMVDVVKMQYALKSDVARIDFVKRLKERFQLDVLNPKGVVKVSGYSIDENKVDEFWKNLISSVEEALNRRNFVASGKFQSKSELENTLHRLDVETIGMIEGGFVGIYVSYENYQCIANFVGAQNDVEQFIKKLQPAMLTGRRSDSGDIPRFVHLNKASEHLQENIFVELVDISDDHDTYFEIADLKDALLEKFPGVKMIKEGNENTLTYKFICADKKELTAAITWLGQCFEKMKKKEICFSHEVFRFISHNKNVEEHLRLKLQILHSALIVSSGKISVLCQEKDLKTSEKIVWESIKNVEVEGTWSPEAKQIQEESHGKISVFEGNQENYPKRMVILYTQDVSPKVKMLASLLQRYKHKEKKQYPLKKVKEMQILGVIDRLQKKYKDILIYAEDTFVIVQGPENNCVAACLDELDTAVQQIEFVEINFLSELQQKLVQNGKIQTYMTEKLKGKIAFIEERRKVKGFVFMKENEESKSCISRDIKNCMVEKVIDKQCIENDKGRKFISEHAREVVVAEEGNNAFCRICFIKDLSPEFLGILYSYSKNCTGVVGDYLRSLDDKCLKEIERNHNVGIEIENDRIYVKGPYIRGKTVITEIESHVRTSVLHFGELDYKRKELLEADKNQIDSIAERCRCCWKADLFPYEPTQTAYGKGIEYLCTWKLPYGNEQVSLAEIDYNTASPKGLIIPVNHCLFGEDIYDTEREKCYSKKPIQELPLKIGEFRCLEGELAKTSCLKGELAKTSLFVLVTSESRLAGNEQSKFFINADDLQKVCSKIFDMMFKAGIYKVGFVLPTKDQSMIGKVEAVIEGFREVTQLYDNMPNSQMIFCVKTEAERWMQEVDFTLKNIQYVTRNISPRYKGLLKSPCTSVEIAKKSILETAADCIVVAISETLDLSKGFVSNLVLEECGHELQNELYLRYKRDLRPWELVMCKSYHLSKKGVQKLIFGNIPHWNECKKLEELEVFVENCLLLADGAGCLTVAFPALGTGKLWYPLRDVAEALFNGVGRYMSEGIIGHISTIYITVPEKEYCMYQILEREKEIKRLNENSTGKQTQEDDKKFLVAESESVNYAVLSKSVCEKMRSVKHVDVKFIPGNSVYSVKILHSWELHVTFGETKEDLKRGVTDVVELCEDQKITCVNIFYSNFKDFKKVSEADNVDIFIQLFEEAVESLHHKRKQKVIQYLRNVRIVIESDAAFSSVFEKKTNYLSRKGRLSFIRSFYWKANTKVLDWSIASHHSPVTTQCLNITLAGCKESDLERAKDEITEYIEGRDYCDIDPDMNSDQVSAELNPGIVKYLAKLDSDAFKKWKKELSKAFKVYFWMNKDISKIEIRGDFCNILKSEKYFETEFPKLPFKTQTDLDFNDEHFSKSDLNTTSAAEENLYVGKDFPVTFKFEEVSYRFGEVDMTVICQDITDYNVDCIVSPLYEGMSDNMGIAKSISGKAGKKYIDECAALRHKQPLESSKVMITSSGDLPNCNHVIHVCIPQKFDDAKQVDQLITIQKSIEKCLRLADQRSIKSIAIPFLGIDRSHFPAELCAQQYFRAISSFKRQGLLEKVCLVDLNACKVNSVCSIIAKCFKVEDKYPIIKDAMIKFSTDLGLKCYAGEGEMHTIKADIVVMRVDEKFNGYRNEISDLISCSSPRLNTKYEEQRSIPHSPTSVTPIRSDADELFRHAFFAVIPKWKHEKQNYEKHVCITMKHIFENTDNLKATSVAFSVLCLDDDFTAKTASCKAMVESILEYFTDNKATKIKTLHLLTKDMRDITGFVHALISHYNQKNDESKDKRINVQPQFKFLEGCIVTTV